MNVLVTYASKHGSTADIARVIADELGMAGFSVGLEPADSVDSIESYDAVILGSAIYVGQWQQAALNLIEREQDALKQRDVWLFTSGPIGEDPFPKDEPPATIELLAKTGAHEHQGFTGKLDRTKLGFGERLIASVVRAPEGDFRDWEAIRAWAISIGRILAEIGARTTPATR